jgi:hypothetical protein
MKAVYETPIKLKIVETSKHKNVKILNKMIKFQLKLENLKHANVKILRKSCSNFFRLDRFLRDESFF